MRSFLALTALLAACTTYVEPHAPVASDAEREALPGTWSRAYLGSVESDYRRYASALAVSPAGSVDVLYAESYQNGSFYKSSVYTIDPRTSGARPSGVHGDSWSTNLGTGLAATSLSSGQLCAAFSRPYDRSLIVSCGASSTTIADASHQSLAPPAVAEGPDGLGHVVWADTGYDIHYLLPDGSVVTPYRGSKSVGALDVSVDDDGQVWILSVVDTTVRTMKLTHGTPDDGWVTETLVGSDVGEGAAAISIATHGSELAYAWVSGSNAYVMVDGTQHTLTTDSGYAVELAYGPHGDLHAAWVDGDDLRMGVLVDGAWTTESIYHSSYGTPGLYHDTLQLELDGAGVPHVVAHRNFAVSLYSRSNAFVDAPQPELLTVDDLVHGDLVVTEILANPSQVSDTYGEWIEVYNASGAEVALDGLLIEDEVGNAGLLTSDAILAAGDYAVLGRRDAASFQGFDVVPAGYYGHQPALNNGGDQVFLVAPQGLVDAAAAYDSGVSGVSLQLDAELIDADANDDAAAWCLSAAEHASGEQATPGASNDPC